MNDQTSVPSISQAPPNSAAQPPPRAERRWRLWRIYPSTWLVMLLAAGAMFLFEFSGRRASDTKYVHGWPMAWMGHDTPNDPFLVTFYRDERIPGFAFEVDSPEESGEPWAFDQTIYVSSVGFAIDVSFVVLVAVAVGGVFQWWRRRHGTLLRYRLRTLLAGVAALALLIAPVAFWHRDRQAEMQVFQGLTPAGVSGQIDVIWVPPVWLPESVAKIGGIRRLFDRVNLLSLHGEHFTANELSPLERLTRLESLAIDGADISDDGFHSLSRLTELRSLSLTDANVSDQRLAQLANLSQLKSLKLGKTDVSDAGLALLSTLHDLRELDLTSDRITGKGLSQLSALKELRSLALPGKSLTNDAVASIEQLQSLETLTLSTTAFQTLHLQSLPRLSELTLINNRSLESLNLQELPALKSVYIQYDPSHVPAGHLALQLSGVDNLEGLRLERIALDHSVLSSMQRLSRLRCLDIWQAQLGDSENLDLVGEPSLQTLRIGESELVEIHLADTPNLVEVEYASNPKLTTVRLERLPRLTTIELTDDPRLSNVDLRNTNGIQKVVIDLNEKSDAYLHRQTRLRIRGLADLAELRSLSIRHPAPLDTEFLGDLSRLQKLREVALSSECVRDEDLSALGRLKNLTSLDLSHGSITGQGLAHLHGLSSLTTIDLRYTPVSDEAVAALQKALPNLVSVQFESKKPVVQDLRQQVALVRNRLSARIACQLNPEKLADRDFECLAELENLETLDLSHTHLTDAGLQCLRRLPKLRSLSLRRTQITDAGVRVLKDLPALTHLDVDETLISDEGRRALGQLIAPPATGER